MAFGRMFPSFNVQPTGESAQHAQIQSPPRSKKSLGGEGVIGGGKVGPGGKGLGKGGLKRHRYVTLGNKELHFGS